MKDVGNKLKGLYFRVMFIIALAIGWFMFMLPMLINESNDFTPIIGIGISAIMIPALIQLSYNAYKKFTAEDGSQ